MKFFDLLKRNRVIVSLILAAGMVSAVWIAWFIGATSYQRVIDKWIAVGRSQGYEISYDGREEFGFPKRTVLRFTNVRWKNTDGVEFHAGDLDISADLWQTKNFNVKFKGQVEIETPAEDSHYSLVLAGEGGAASVRLSDDGLWENCSITMKAAQLGRSPDYLFLIGNIKLSAERPAKEPEDSKTAGLTLALSAENVTLPAAMPATFGSKMPKLEVDLHLMGAVPDFRKHAAAEAWSKINGRVDFDKLNMEWGDLLINSRGTMNFDDDLQPEGVFAAVVGHQDQVLDKLTKGGFIAATQQEILGSAMRYLAKPTPIEGTTGIEIPIAVQLGGFFLGPIKIFSFPAIDWDS